MQPALAEQPGSRFDLQQQELARAFSSFTQAAGSLERSYAQLQSEVVRLRRELEEKNLELSRSQVLVEVLAVLAHEIRNPLGSLELFANLLADNAASAGDRADWIAQIQGGVRALAATVNNVLHFHSPPPASLVPCDLGELLDRAAEFVAPLTAQHGLQWEISNRLYGLSRPADPHRFQQVLLNLVLNALRFTPAGGRIAVTANAQPEAGGGLAACIQISDTGSGIAPEHLEKIFTAGFSTGGSPGLGLAVCKKIIEQHSGTISATSQPGAGATFTVRLPLP